MDTPSPGTLRAARLHATELANQRQPRTYERVVDGHTVGSVSSFFGINTFDARRMAETLPRPVYRNLAACLTGDTEFDAELADAVAHAVKDWAIERGATHFTHWFQPMTGSTAEKHDAFLDFDADGQPLERLSGENLLRSEPDASSFPSGGARSTFEARGYTAWDPSSPMFLMEGPNSRTLCIPSVFISYNGDALDTRTPLLRSLEALDRAGRQLLETVGEQPARVTATVGCEQEFFLVDRAVVAVRPDLAISGRTLVGTRPPKGQSMEDHYFGAISPRVLAFLEEAAFELYKLGVPFKTEHNEVAPSQFEIAAHHAEAAVAVDHNQLVMEVLRRLAPRHDFHVLMHEKPFARVNGSGKHLNWSLVDDTGDNLLEPGETPESNLRFLALLASVLLGVHRRAGMLRASVASHGNDFRLGANEAPPAIISVFLGELLSGICEAIADGRAIPENPGKALVDMGLARLPRIARDNTDRNRTSPLAFTGDKFEFRAPGSSQNPAEATTVLNAAVADGMFQVSTWAREAGGGSDGVFAAIRRALVESRQSCFEGNNYADSWRREATARGLPNLERAPDAFALLRQPAHTTWLEELGIYTRQELDARYRVHAARYLNTVEIEVDLLRDLVDTWVLPAVTSERAALARDLHALLALEEHGVPADSAPERERLEALTGLLVALRQARRQLDEILEETRTLDDCTHSTAHRVVPHLGRIRELVDALETRVSDDRWPLLKYREFLFLV